MMKIKTSWDLSVLYKSARDPKLEADVVSIEKAYLQFESRYKGKTDYLQDESKLHTALSDYEKLFATLPLSAPIQYFYYRKDLKSDDAEAEAKINQLTERLTKSENKLLFFELALAKISQKQQKVFLESSTLAHFRYFLTLIFKRSLHDLSEAEEKIMSVKSMPSHTLWVNGSEKILHKQSVVFKKKSIPLAEASNLVSQLGTADRRALHTLIVQKLFEISDVAENEINAVVINKKINDELRHYEKPYSATVFGYQNEESTVEALVKAVNGAQSISHRFYKLKAKLLKVPKLEYADRNASIGKTEAKIPLEESIEILQKSFSRVDPEYKAILERFLRDGQIDVYPKLGKTGGAYCSGNINAPTFVLLNYVGGFDSLTTFGHEMGHAIHTELSKEAQPPLYKHYTISAAEVASTLFEQFVFDDIFENLSEKEKFVALHNQVNDDIQTIFRQIACFNFELELHNTIRAKGSLPKEEIAALMNKHMKAYLGPAFKLTDLDGYFFVWWSHIRNFFYVYSYALGKLTSKALYRKYKADPKFAHKIKQFLKAGGSASPEDIFRSIGVDITTPEFFKEGLAEVEAGLKKLEQLAQKKK